MPTTHRSLFPPLDENSALEELQRFHREIQRARRDREQASDAFEAFVRGFRAAPAPPPDDAHAQGRARFRPAETVTRPAPAPENTVVPPAREARPRDASDSTEATPRPARGRRTGAIAWMAAAGLAVAVIALAWRSQSPAPAPEQPSGSAPAARQSAPPPAPTSAERTQVSGTPAGATEAAIELRTVRPVWLRVTVDGRRALERELPAGERIPLNPAQGAIVRAGDAGAVEVRIKGGAARPLGTDGQVVTRRFEPPFRD